MKTLAGIFSLILLIADSKASTLSYSMRGSIDGCFRNFQNTTTHFMGDLSSHLRCQERCRYDGFILAATKGPYCHCGNEYPSEERVTEDQCNTRCRPYTECGDAQSCCGGPDAFSVNTVGDLDVRKLVLKRLANTWRTNIAYRNQSLEHVTKELESRAKNADWWRTLDHGGQSYCDGGLYMTGVYRSPYKWGDERIGRLEEGDCRSPPTYLESPLAEDQDCYQEDIHLSFDHRGWGSCKEGYYMAGMVSSRGPHLYNIEALKCCRPKHQTMSWGQCYEHDTSSSLRQKGWSRCNEGYYMAGMYRSDCKELSCIKRFRCCRMGVFDGVSFKEEPTISIKVKDANGKVMNTV